MKRILALALLFTILATLSIADEINYTYSVEVVRSAYNKVIDSNADGDAAYDEIYNVIRDLRSAVLMNDKQEIGYAQVKLFGWEDDSTPSELLKKSDALSTFIVSSNGDKLSALMRKFATMNSVKGTIEPTRVAIEVTDMEKFVAELGLCKKATGYVLAMLDIYVYEREAVIFTESGFIFEWNAVGAYQMDLGNLSSSTTERTSSSRTLKEGVSGDDVYEMKKRLQDLGYFSADASLSKKYNATTTARVKLFQQINDLPQTGKADSSTLGLLYSNNAKANPSK